MFGKFRHTVDSKGRLFVPSKLKEDLGSAFYVTIGIERCLTVYTQASWAGVMERYNALPMSKAAELRFLFANAAKCEPDKQGRFLLPAGLRDYASLTQDVVFIGQGNHAEIWNAEVYDEMERRNLTPENLKATVDSLQF